MRTGTQFTGRLNPNQSLKWFTFGWPTTWHVVRYVVPTTPQVGAPEVHWDIEVERASVDRCTYWITVKNLTGAVIDFEGRYAVLN
ncbi:hypothetical protein SAMN05661080_03595 [Modestobacter sp. DSM 44400]|uniref:hypothetical protein n=1 Tax=Modestobacter sp. DSM 44400 TaxID=1550230 RepID=UPI0008963B36|nr:hypothetical protein [Modestobacter sp. DSM 44400]SDY47754.1 hypothetical protein SAMN05661080_03595 [Modestobacter sp. DSM 44400]